ncbi:MAG TPA: ribose-phosphate diphosphokinase [Methanotrichaceae archaeon]|nr:ribose-phosphate diphosphokinase [Methanotrichaceae archaeon]
MIIGGPASQLLAGRVAGLLGDELALCEYKTFPDGESYTQVLGDGDRVTIIQSTPTDRDLIYLLQLLDIFRERQISLVIPYYGYARQDKQFKPGEPITARAIAYALNPFLGEKSRVYCVNIHARSVLSHFRVQAENLDATPLLADRIKEMGLQKPVIISPDKGAVAMAKTAADHLGVEFDHLEKTRLSGTEVTMAPKEIDAKGRDIVIFDDMIATGGTMATAISMLRKQGANRVFLASVHPVLTGNAVIKLYRSGVAAVLATDTLDKAVSTVSVAPIIAEALRSQ